MFGYWSSFLPDGPAIGAPTQGQTLFTSIMKDSSPKVREKTYPYSSSYCEAAMTLGFLRLKTSHPHSRRHTTLYRYPRYIAQREQSYALPRYGRFSVKTHPVTVRVILFFGTLCTRMLVRAAVPT